MAAIFNAERGMRNAELGTFPGSRRFRVPRSEFLVPAYTLMELLVVVVVLGLSGAVVVPQLSNPGSLKIQAAARMVVSDLLAAQNEAVGQAATRRVHFDVPNNSYRMTDGNDATIAVPWMKTGLQVSFTADTRFSGVKLDAVDFGGATWVGFDELGSPQNGGTVDMSSEGHKYRIDVRAFTGRVTVAPIP